MLRVFAWAVCLQAFLVLLFKGFAALAVGGLYLLTPHWPWPVKYEWK